MKLENGSEETRQWYCETNPGGAGDLYETFVFRVSPRNPSPAWHRREASRWGFEGARTDPSFEIICPCLVHMVYVSILAGSYS